MERVIKISILSSPPKLMSIELINADLCKVGQSSISISRLKEFNGSNFGEVSFLGLMTVSICASWFLAVQLQARRRQTRNVAATSAPFNQCSLFLPVIEKDLFYFFVRMMKTHVQNNQKVSGSLLCLKTFWVEKKFKLFSCISLQYLCQKTQNVIIICTNEGLTPPRFQE